MKYFKGQEYRKDAGDSPVLHMFGDGQGNYESFPVDDLKKMGLAPSDFAALKTAGFTPIERETIEIDGEIQPSVMVLCEKDGRKVRVPLEPGSGNLTGAFYEDTEN